MANDEKEEFRVLREGLGGGPHGLGDPEDQSLRRVEKEIVIPQKMKEKAKRGQCAAQVKGFGECAKESGLLLPLKCRQQAKQLEICLTAAYKDPKFIEECTTEYLKERTEYRKTGIKQKMKKKDNVMI